MINMTPYSTAGVEFSGNGYREEALETNPFLIAQRQLEEAVEILELDDATH